MRESALSLPFCSKWQDDRRREDETNDRTLNVLRCAPAAGAEAPSVRSGRCRTKEIQKVHYALLEQQINLQPRTFLSSPFFILSFFRNFPTPSLRFTYPFLLLLPTLYSQFLFLVCTSSFPYLFSTSPYCFFLSILLMSFPNSLPFCLSFIPYSSHFSTSIISFLPHTCHLRCFDVPFVVSLFLPFFFLLNLLKPNDIYIQGVYIYICRTAALTSRRYILNIYSTNIHTEYFKHAAQSPFFSLQNAVYFIMLPCLVPVLFAFYLQGVLKFKCKIPAPKG